MMYIYGIIWDSLGLSWIIWYFFDVDVVDIFGVVNFACP